MRISSATLPAIEKFSENFVPSDTKMVERVIIIGAGRSGYVFFPPCSTRKASRSRFSIKTANAAARWQNSTTAPGHLRRRHGTSTSSNREGIADADVVICLTDDDRLNLMLALIAKHLGAKKTIVRVSRIEYGDLGASASISSCRHASCRPAKSWPLPAAAVSSPCPSWKGPRLKPWKSSSRTGLP